MQRKCRNEACATQFFDHDALDQLHEGDILAIPFTPHMAYGEIFIGKSLEYDISMLMTKGHGAATIAKMLRCAKARHNYMGVSDRESPGCAGAPPLAWRYTRRPSLLTQD